MKAYPDVAPNLYRHGAWDSRALNVIVRDHRWSKVLSVENYFPDFGDTGLYGEAGSIEDSGILP